MSKTIKVEIEVKKTVKVSLRRRDADSLPWDWYTDGGDESSGYYATIEDALDNAEVVLSR